MCFYLHNCVPFLLIMCLLLGYHFNDMVIFDPKTLSSEIYEIKYSKEVVSNQYVYLIDEELNKNTEFHFGKITKKVIIYRGESLIHDDIKYINVEEYLNGLYE